MNRYVDPPSWSSATPPGGRYAGSRTKSNTRRTSRGYAAALAALLVAGLAGCGGGDSTTPATGLPTSAGTPITLPTLTPSGAGTGTTTGASTGGFDVLANMPMAAKQHTNAGAQAFVRYYIEAFGRLLMNPAKGQLPKLAAVTCRGCADHERILTENVDAGRLYSTQIFRTLNVGEPDANGNPVDASAVTDLNLFSLVETSTVSVAAAGSTTSKPGIGKLLVRWRLSWRDGQWVITMFEGNKFTPATT